MKIIVDDIILEIGDTEARNTIEIDGISFSTKSLPILRSLTQLIDNLDSEFLINFDANVNKLCQKFQFERLEKALNDEMKKSENLRAENDKLVDKIKRQRESLRKLNNNHGS